MFFECSVSPHLALFERLPVFPVIKLSDPNKYCQLFREILNLNLFSS